MNKTAFVFPGQGSQSVGMMSSYLKKYPEIEEIFQQASSLLGYDLLQLISDGPIEQLNQTEYTQPALLVAEYVIWLIHQKVSNNIPICLAGHSLGEYSALLCAGTLDFDSAVKLVAERGRLMQHAVPAGQGSMAAIIGLSDQDVEKVCLQAAENQVVAPANFNCPGQIVIAGHSDAVLRAMEHAKLQGAKLVKQLPVSIPSHCSLLKDAAQEFAQVLASVPFQAPRIAVIQNVDVEVHQHPDDIRACLAKQLWSPVRWVETVQRIVAEGVENILECGPGKVLTGLNKRIEKNIVCFSLQDAEIENVLLGV